MTAAEILAAAAVPVAQAVPAQIPGAALGVVTTAGDHAVEVFGLAQREPDPVRRCVAPMWFDLASAHQGAVYDAHDLAPASSQEPRHARRTH